MDIVYINGLEIETIIGVYEWEKNIKQTVILDIELFCDITKAARTDNLSYAIDYALISTQVTELIAQNRFQLIETLAEQTAQLILTGFPVEKLKIRVSTPGAIENANDVGIVIERSSTPST